MYKLLVFTECLIGVYDGKIICYHGKKKLLLNADKVVYLGKLLGRSKYRYVAVYDTRSGFFDDYLYDGSAGYNFKDITELREVIWQCEYCGYKVRGIELRANALLYEDMAKYNNGYARCPNPYNDPSHEENPYTLVKVYLDVAWRPRLTAEQVRRLIGEGKILIKERAEYEKPVRKMGKNELEVFAEKTVREKFGKDRVERVEGCDKIGVVVESEGEVQGVPYKYGIIYGFGCGEENLKMCRGFVFESGDNKVYLCTDYLDRTGFLKMIRETRIPPKYMGVLGEIAKEYGVYDEYVKILAEKLYGSKTYMMMDYVKKTNKPEDVAEFLDKVLRSNPILVDVAKIWFGEEFARKLKGIVTGGVLLKQLHSGEEEKLTRKHYGMVLKELIEKIPEGYDAIYVSTDYGVMRLCKKSRYDDNCYIAYLNTTMRIDVDRLLRVGIKGELIIQRDGIAKPVTSYKRYNKYIKICTE